MNQTTYSFPQIISRGTYKTNLSSGNKSINECLGILLRTRPGELLGDPTYGCMLIERIFMYQGIIVEALLKEDIINAVSAYEPRIDMQPSDITIVADKTTVKIYIQYTIKSTGQINEYNMEITADDNPYRI